MIEALHKLERGLNLISTLVNPYYSYSYIFRSYLFYLNIIKTLIKPWTSVLLEKVCKGCESFLAHMNLIAPLPSKYILKLTDIIVGRSLFFSSGSIYFFIFAISYIYCTHITPLSMWPGRGVNFSIPDPLCRNQLVYGGFTMNLKVLSVNAVSLTFIGTSGLICPVILLNSSQNFIILTPSGPSA